MSIQLQSKYVFILLIAVFFFIATVGDNEVHLLDKNAVNYSEALYDVKTAPVMFGEIRPDRKYAVFSTTSTGNAESLSLIFMLPLTALAWKRIGFHSVIIVVGSANVWNSDTLLYTVLNSVRNLDAVVIFLDAHPVNSFMVRQVRNMYSLITLLIITKTRMLATANHRCKKRFLRFLSRARFFTFLTFFFIFPTFFIFKNVH